MIPSFNTPLSPSTTKPAMPYELLNSSATGDHDPAASDSGPMREAFGDFVGQTLFGSMLATMRESVGKAAYFDGGRAEEIFQQQLDQKLVEEISNASSKSFVDPMFDLFQLQRRG
jgi:hypothetical protein